MASIKATPAPLPPNVYDVDAADPKSELVDRSEMDPSDVAHIGELMAALGRLRAAEQELSEASLKYMKLNQSDMRALHYLIVAANTETIATPGAIASHLKISTASTTKLLDRLENAGHIIRQPHPSDRRALAISITAKTRQAAMETVGRQQSKRFHAAARLSAAERDVVIRFLDDMTQEISLTNEPWAQPPASPE
ncbi:DNA-binding MarR family transcriptional regulator [Arthrobacter stackebrandtii]|uniref:DNA-binding MarR family transcriptional regulator n=1 Tax=Arthrobacter stackebrandtii TaxID=272161 RepID=A0ABS4YZH7_9MICC|nr:MarR family transcriptional regulator [Arthrobacter stackebrandtii]MBP2414205.1 DNA-binding MarR family transcriptional regulator [Arthrobacter stackebrandtii]PYG98976.1 MarR family transcriptional regulator [Arthrobacter stackebrandtii]